jgi:hypothetical protein
MTLLVRPAREEEMRTTKSKSKETWKDSESEFSEGYVLRIALELLGSNVSAEDGKAVVA